MRQPLVSVIINCHNGQKYLADCINSVLNQSYKNLEIIFWDNCSSDESLKIINNFKDKRIRKFRSTKFLKLYKSRNLAINKSRGRYITFCDTDDLWVKDKITKQVSLVNKNKKIKIIYSNYYILNEINKKKYLKHIQNLPSGKITQSLLNDYVVGILTVFIDRKILKKNLFNSNYNIIGDFDLFIRLSTKYKFYSIQQPLAFYRVHLNNFSTTRKNIYISELKNWLKIRSKIKSLRNYSYFYIRFYLFKLKFKKFLDRIV